MEVDRVRSQAWKLAYWLALYGFGLAVSARMNWGGLLGLPSRVLGFLLIGLAFALSASAGRHLRLYGKSRPGGFGQIDRLVTVGIYSCVRHPNHLGLAVLSVGLALALDSLSHIIVATTVQVLGVVAFVHLVEEPEVRRKFGREYEEYASRVRGLVPDVPCLFKNLIPRSEPRG